MTLRELVFEVFDPIREREEGEVYVDCCFCEDNGETADKRQRFGINTITGDAHCFNCEYSMKSAEKVFRAICDKYDLDYRFSFPTGDEAEILKRKKSLTVTSLPVEFEPLWQTSKDRLHKQALRYLIGRKVTEKQIEEHMIGFCAVGKYAHRIVFPVYRKSSVVGFVARDFTGKQEPPYLNSKGLKYLWNLPAIPKNKKAILCEGIFDALAAERVIGSTYSQFDCLGRLGRTLTEDQLDALKRYKKIVIWPDPDEPGVKGAISVAKQLKEQKILLYTVIPKAEDTDLGSMSDKRIRNRFKHRHPWSNFAADLMLSRIVFN